MTAEPTPFAARTAADLMLREPKTLPGDASVSEVRAVLANPKVHMVLLADGTRFRAAVTEIPGAAPDTEPAATYADPNPATIASDVSGELAFQRAAASPNRRVIVLGDDDELLGLLCLDPGRTHFCQTSSAQ